jgi:hypothetical protein
VQHVAAHQAQAGAAQARGQQAEAAAQPRHQRGAVGAQRQGHAGRAERDLDQHRAAFGTAQQQAQLQAERAAAGAPAFARRGRSSQNSSGRPSGASACHSSSTWGGRGNWARPASSCASARRPSAVQAGGGGVGRGLVGHGALWRAWHHAGRRAIRGGRARHLGRIQRAGLLLLAQRLQGQCQPARGQRGGIGQRAAEAAHRGLVELQRRRIGLGRRRGSRCGRRAGWCRFAQAFQHRQLQLGLGGQHPDQQQLAGLQLLLQIGWQAGQVVFGQAKARAAGVGGRHQQLALGRLGHFEPQHIVAARRAGRLGCAGQRRQRQDGEGP